MDLNSILSKIDARTARAFVTAARHLIDALLIEAQSVREAQAPTVRDYATADLPREAPAGGWLSHDELRAAAQRMAEAIAAEKWVDGALFAIRALAAVGAL